jgi:predicted RND superfamily exporter protein
VARRTRVLLVVAAAASVLAALQLVDVRSGRLRIAVDASLDGLAAPDTAPAEAERTRLRFGAGEAVLVVLQVEDAFQPDVLQRVDRLSRALAAFGDVASVDSLTATALPYAESGTLRYTRMRSEDLSDPAAIARLRAAALGDPLVRGQLVSADARAAAIVVRLDAQGERDALRTDLAGRIRQAAHRERAPGVTIHVTGAPIVHSALGEAILRQLRRVVPAIAVVLTALLALAFRSVHGVLLPLATIAVALLWTGATASLLGQSLNLVTALVPPLLVTMGLAYCAHVLSDFEALLRERGPLDPVERTAALLENIGGPVLVTGLTTMAGLLALLVNEQAQVRAFAVLAAIGVGWLVVIALILVPAALSLVAARRAPRPLPGASLLAHGGRWIARFDRERRPWILAGAALGFVVAIACATRIEVGDAFVGVFAPQSRVRSDYEAVNAVLGGVNPLDIVVEGGADAWTDPALLHALDRLVAWLREQPEVGAAVGLVDHVRMLSRHLGGDVAAGIPGSREVVRQLLFFGEGELLGSAVDRDRSSTRIGLRLRVDDTASIARFLERLEPQLAALPPGLTTHLGGNAVRMAQSVATVTRGQLQSVALALGLVCVALCIQFMSLRVGLLASLPTALQTALYFGALGLGGIPLNATTSLVECLVLGLAVDDTIHYLARFGAATRRSGSEPEAASQALAVVLRPVTLTKGILAVGFLLLVTGELRNQVLFGWLAAFTLGCSWLVDVFVTPAFVSRLRITTLWDMLRLDLGDDVRGTIPLFANLTHRQARTFALMANLHTLPAGTKLLREGDPAGDIYVLIDGELRIWLERNGREVELARVGRGTVIGEGGYFGRRRNANVDTLSESRLLRFDDADQERICRAYPAIAARVFLALNRLQAERHLERLSTQARAGLGG